MNNIFEQRPSDDEREQDGLENRSYVQVQDIIASIKKIIKDYPHESIFREFLQNADDAKATKFKIIIDERNSPTDGLINKVMGELQGPAIWIYNDRVFDDTDLDSLLKMYDGSKAGDNTKIGKFGIGFRSCFNFTDAPSFVTGDQFRFLDPQGKYIPSGYARNYTEKKFLRLYSNQLEPFRDIAGFNPEKKFGGTLFRLPLRNAQSKSKITDVVYNSEEIITFLQNFKNDATSCLLFLKYVESIDVYHLKETEEEEHLWSINITNSNEIKNKRSSYNINPEVFALNTVMKVMKDKTEEEKNWIVCTGGNNLIEDPRLERFAERNRLKPWGGVAALNDNNLDNFIGRLFCFFPLAQVTNLPVHLNGIWANNSSRNNILLNDDTLSDKNESYLEWNRYILLKVLPKLYIKILEHLVNLASNQKNKNFQEKQIIVKYWPLPEISQEQYVKEFGSEVLKLLPRDVPLFFTRINGGKYVTFEKACFENDQLIIDLLENFDCEIVRLEHKYIEDLGKSGLRVNKLATESICSSLRNRDIDYITDKYAVKDITRLLKFLLKDQSYGEIKGIKLLPLEDGKYGTFGDRKYIATEDQKNLLPNVKKSFFIHRICMNDPELRTIFESQGFQNATNIISFSAKTLVHLLNYQLNKDEDIDNWDPSSYSIPNLTWLEKIWEIILASDYAVETFGDYPLLDIYSPNAALCRLDLDNPVFMIPRQIIEGDANMINILMKLGVKFTRRNIHDKLMAYILEWNHVNVLRVLEGFIREEEDFLANNHNITPNDIEEIKKYLRSKWISLVIGNQIITQFKYVLENLKIWPTFPNGGNFFKASDVSLKPRDILLFEENSQRLNGFFYENENINDVTITFDRQMLTTLGARVVEFKDFLREYIVFPKRYREERKYVDFIKSVLVSNNFSQAEQFLNGKEAIPNNSDKALRLSRNLYCSNEPLFRTIFKDTGKLVHSDIESDETCLIALSNMGLKITVNRDTFLECAEAIDRRTGSNNDLVERARVLVNHLYERFEEFEYNREDIQRLSRKKFVPVDNDIGNTYEKNYVKIIDNDMGCFESLCLYKYKDIAWTQLGIIDSRAVPANINQGILDNFPELGRPKPTVILEHLKTLKKMALDPEIDETYPKQFMQMLKKTYEALNEVCCDENDDDASDDGYGYDKLTQEDFNPGYGLFLNINESSYESPYNENNWVDAEELRIGVYENDEGYVKKSISKYQNLLQIAGACVVKNPTQFEFEDMSSYSEGHQLLERLQNFLVESPQSYNDVIFIVQGEEIHANRAILATCKHFERSFYGSFNIPALNEPFIINQVCDDISPNSFRNLLKIMYGCDLDRVISEENNNNSSGGGSGSSSGNDNGSNRERILNLLLDLLKGSDYYGLVNTKKKIEIKLSAYVRRANFETIYETAVEYTATQLKNYCEAFREDNPVLFQD